MKTAQAPRPATPQATPYANPGPTPATTPNVGPCFSRASSSTTKPAAKTEPNPKRTISTWLLIIAIHFYRAILSPFLGGNCKFYPSCSHYAEEAIRLHGPRRGMLLAAKRLLRCRPFTKGGYDPVPDRNDFDYHPALHGQEPSR
jgi:uncharacterized protein